ncbi:MAG: hypothetical protein ABSF54_07235 [Bryobacteraceae bacterium]
MEFILEQQAQAAAIRIQHDADIARIDVEIQREDFRLKRAIRLAVQEARAERKRRREADERFDVKMDQLASSQLLTEEKLRALGDKIDKVVDDIRRPGGNGHPQ